MCNLISAPNAKSFENIIAFIETKERGMGQHTPRRLKRLDIGKKSDIGDAFNAVLRMVRDGRLENSGLTSIEKIIENSVPSNKDEQYDFPKSLVSFQQRAESQQWIIDFLTAFVSPGASLLEIGTVTDEFAFVEHQAGFTPKPTPFDVAIVGSNYNGWSLVIRNFTNILLSDCCIQKTASKITNWNQQREETEGGDCSYAVTLQKV